MITGKRVVASGIRDGGGSRLPDEASAVLFGREKECLVIGEVLNGVRTGRGSPIVLFGDPGIGKSTLLEWGVDSAGGFHVLRAVGNEAERELPFAAAQQLCRSNLSTLEELPQPQRDALGVAFGLMSGPTPDRLFVGLALLGLLTNLASREPVLCVIDDAQWLDRESAQAFAIAARRANSESLGFMFGARTIPSELDGLPCLHVDGLDLVDARALLQTALPSPFDEHVLERILAESRGNPLALLELPLGMTPAELAGGFAVPLAGPIATRIEKSFQRRIAKLSESSRTLLLVAALEPTGNPVLIWQAARQLGVDESENDVVQGDGLLEMTPQVIFRHPLVRSAAYDAATVHERHLAHLALADATDAAVDPDRRAWHRALAACRPNEEVATELEASADRAQARGGFPAAAAFLERAGELTLDPNLRVARTLAAAEAKRQAGALHAALKLASNAEQGPIDARQRARLDVLRARVSFASDRGRDAPALLLGAAQGLEPYDPVQAQDIYLDALTAALFAGGFGTSVQGRDVASAVLASAGAPSRHVKGSDLLLRGLAVLVVEGPARGTPIVRRAIEVFLNDEVGSEERLRCLWLAARTACYFWDFNAWNALSARQLVVARETGAMSILPLTLSTSAGVQLFAGRLSEAESLIEQAEAVSDATDTKTALYGAVLVAAFRGREDEASPFIDASAADFDARGEGMGVTLAGCAKAVLYNGLGRYEEAYGAAEAVLGNRSELWFWTWVSVELIEAASRTGRTAEAKAAFTRLMESTAASGTPWAAAVENRCRALISDGVHAEALFRKAIELLTPTELQLDLARTRLLFGEGLRREGRPADAREQLRLAHEAFSDFGCESFAERARVELRATGERTRKRASDSTERLTPQEARVAHLVAQGNTNAEIAAQMFLSASTVVYHLHKVFRKLGITSRTQLARRILVSEQSEEDG